MKLSTPISNDLVALIQQKHVALSIDALEGIGVATVIRSPSVEVTTDILHA